MVGGVTARCRPCRSHGAAPQAPSEDVGELRISLAATDRVVYELDAAPEIGESGGADDTAEAAARAAQSDPGCRTMVTP